MKTKPILFSAPMIRALLADKKTQTRRILNPSPEVTGIFLGENLWNWNPTKRTSLTANTACVAELWLPYCPYGKVGDRLWVRETWQAWAEFDKVKADALPLEMRALINYPANGNTWDSRLRPSIHMPRWASRLTLEITDVRAHRLQEISAADARAEGIPVPDCGPMSDLAAIDHFALVWNNINGADAWEKNPWTWAISFRRLEVSNALGS